jgi:uncharacterized Zn finger protein
MFNATCPGCGHRLQETLKLVVENPSVTCPGCGMDVDIQFKDENGVESTASVGQLETKQGARGSMTFSVEVYNLGLNKRRLIRATDPEIIKQKVLC